MIISSETGEVLGSSVTRLAGMLRTGKFEGRDDEISLGFRIAIKRAMEDPRRGWVIKDEGGCLPGVRGGSGEGGGWVRNDRYQAHRREMSRATCERNTGR